MSVNNADSAWIPPMFPKQGRIHKSTEQLQRNYRQQVQEEYDYKFELSQAAGMNLPMPCCKSLHLSFFFDGTNNNEKADTVANPPSLSNVARMFHATYEEPDEGYHSFYIPGVGTPFPEIGELDFNADGLKYGKGGEARIHWALVMVLSALNSELTKDYYEESFAYSLVNKLGRGWVGQYLKQDYLLFKPLHQLAAKLESRSTQGS